MRKRTKAEILDYMNNSLQKGDVVIHKLKPKGTKKFVTSYEVIVD